MLYLNNDHIDQCGLPWKDLLDIFDDAVSAFGNGDFSQPVKPYLRYGDPLNRIIAMPAFLGGNCQAAGIKWIASFPNNPEKGVARAHSVSVLNQADNGKPLAMVNGARISAIRTAAVSALVTRWVMGRKSLDSISVGMTGFGPIGQMHLKMMAEQYGSRISVFRIFDPRGVVLPDSLGQLPFRVETCENWEQAYRQADIFMTCTVSKGAYINQIPKPGAFLNNVSLRDFQPVIRNHVDWMIVDDWDEVCREKTDIEVMHQSTGLQREHVMNLPQFRAALGKLDPADVVMFNPMGLAIFDIAVLKFYVDLAQKRGIGIELPDA